MRRFFDVAIAEPATQPQEATSIAAMMAKSGVMNSTETPVATPISITPEKKEEPNPAPEAQPAVTATEPQKAEPASPESPSQPAVTVVPEPQKEAAPPKPPTLQEVLRQHQPDAIYKELGVDADMVGLAKEIKENPKMAAFFSHWKTNGDVKSYLRELSTDYANMSPEDVMRHQLQKDYPKSSPAQLEALYKAKVIRAYNLESVDPDEQEEGKMLLQAEAEKYREGLLKGQQEYLLPPKPEPKAPEPDKSELEAQQKIEAYQSQIKDHSYTKGIVTNKKFVLGSGEEAFTFPIEPEDLMGVLTDDEKWQETQFDIVKNPDGSIKSATPKVEHQLLVAAVAKYGMAFMNEYAKHFKSLGGKSVTTLLENPSQPGQNSPSTPESAPTSPAEAMAKKGTFNPGGYGR